MPFPVLAAPNPLPDVSSDGSVPTSATVFDGVSTKTLRIRSFCPVSFLANQIPQLPAPNKAVVENLLRFPRNGIHPYFWPKRKDAVQYDGSTTDVRVGSLVVMKGEPKGRTYCCGLTLELFYRVAGTAQGFSELLAPGASEEFKNLWFCRAVFSPGPEDAMTSFGLGRKIVKPEDARPGDFVQIWRHKKSGHSVVFIDWARDLKGNIVGIHYWSTQPATRGIGFATELFADGGDGVIRDRLSITRLADRSQ